MGTNGFYGDTFDNGFGVFETTKRRIVPSGHLEEPFTQRLRLVGMSRQSLLRLGSLNFACEPCVFKKAWLDRASFLKEESFHLDIQKSAFHKDFDLGQQTFQFHTFLDSDRSGTVCRYPKPGFWVFRSAMQNLAERA